MKQKELAGVPVEGVVVDVREAAKGGDIRRKVLELRKWMTCTPEMEFGVGGTGGVVGVGVG